MKRSRVQSSEHPSRRIWDWIVSFASRFQAQTRSTNFSRPSWRRSLPSLASYFSITICVAIPAWSMPGTQSTR